ncbi:MAG: hypothetical protein IIY27_03120 [Aeriscardovia sp.]|nr:hypothetical protein [Aeriscardovia sp.]
MSFPAVGQDGKPLKSVTVLVDSYSNFYNYNPTNSIPYVYTDSNSNVPLGDIGVPSGTQVATSSQGDTLTFEGSEVQIFSTSYQGVAYNITPISGVNQSGQSVSYGSYYQAPTIEYSGSGSYTLLHPYAASWALTFNGFLNYIAPSRGTIYLQQVVVGAENPSVSRVEDSSLSSSNFTSTVGSNFPYTYQAEAYLPYGNANLEQEFSSAFANERGSILKGSDHKQAVPTVTDVVFSLSTPGQTVVQSSIKVNGLSLSSLQGSSDSLSGSSLKLTLNPVAIAEIISKGNLPLPSSGMLTQNGVTNHTLSIEWQAYLNTSFTSSASSTYNFTYKMDPIVSSPGDLDYIPSKSYSNLLLTPEVETNGPSDDSAPSSLAKATSVSSLPTSSPSSSTGLWFINGLEDACGSDATQFTVQNSSGRYLSPVEDGGTFEGWQFSSSPYDFKGSDFDKYPYYYLFTFGGLQDGTYTVKSVEHPDISFTSSLSYSSPQVLSGSGSFSFVESNPGPDSQGPISWKMEYAVKDGVLKMTNSSGGYVSQLNSAYPHPLISLVCIIGPPPPPPTPHLPITGGKGILGLSLASSFLFLLGMGSWWGIRRRRSRGASSSSKKHGF